ncbi:unnamed protein product [Adineta ricciae]|uniref:G-protein coupled receptors family 1 profile domain-containing protein n=1 Tax=Adineta ricciae TaxID=249248 RepID=A0A815SSA3_ADIRI|nr:unnamed protein product [Adineta ricciae]
MNIDFNQSDTLDSINHKELFEGVQIIFGFYLIPIICIPGLIGNILCIIVFITNTISDTIKLSNDLLYSLVLIIQAINQEFGKKIFLLLYRYCHYINTVSTLCTAWLTLIVAIERYVLCNVDSRKRLVVQRSSRSICYTIILCSLVLALPVSFRYEIVSISTGNQSLSNSASPISLSMFGRSRAFRLYSISIDVIRAIVPSLFLLYLNTRIVYLLYRMKSSAGTAFYRLTISLIIIIGFFIFCYFPDALLSLILDMGYIDESYQRRAIREITDFFVTLNSAINFPIYFSISYTFRRSVLRLFERRMKSYYPTTYADIIHRQRQQIEVQQQQQLNNIGVML